MAVRNRQNKMLILGVGAVIIAASAVVAIRFLSGPSPTPETSRSSALENQDGAFTSTGEAAADRPGETVQALAADQESMRTRIEDLSSDVATGISGLGDRLLQMTEEISSLRTEQETLADTARTGTADDRMRDEILASVQGMLREFESRNAGDYPVSGGRAPAPGRGVPGADGYVWFSAAAPGPFGDPAVDGGLASLGYLQNLGGVNPLAPPEEEGPPPPVPAYTIPADATLVNSRGLTAIIGRVPLNGQVADPFPFKVITGRDNLLANGQILPELERAIWSGSARGDATLHCVSGRLSQVTFIFRDGTIATYGSPDGNIGWISNRQGYPCIPGKFVSNLKENIAGIASATAASGFARAWSERQTTTIQDGTAVTRAITGDPVDYALGRGIAGGIEEWSRIVAERAREAFDAVVVPPGQDLTLNVTQAIPIDWPPEGRRVRHVSALPVPAAGTRPGGLD